MDAKTFAAETMLSLPYNPNDQQVQVIAALASFCLRPPGQYDTVFILNGYAGTGKTSIMGALVRNLASNGIRTVLLAPTGRAAKVLAANAGSRQTFTIHRRIYAHTAAPDGTYSAPLRENPYSHAVFIVDEASMIGAGDENGRNLIEDLVQFVYSGVNCRMILLGDTAQLPPVGAAVSPAMNPDTFRSLGIRVTRATLTETARQAAGSGILYNATALRRAMRRDDALVPHLTLPPFTDIRAVSSEDLPAILESAYADDPDDTILITRSNRRAAEYNNAIRTSILYREEEISRGDALIVGKNHYFNGDRPAGTDFLANGDILTVERVIGTETRYGGLRFADITVRLSRSGTDPGDSGDEVPVVFDTKIILDCLASTEAGLPRTAYEKLWYGAMTDPEFVGEGASDAARQRSLRSNPYWNALQVKFAYAVTCHKAQGGQWKNVFIDLGYIPDEALGVEFYRWLYTAITRARTSLWLISPPEALLRQ